jgi:hypothetical protein
VTPESGVAIMSHSWECASHRSSTILSTGVPHCSPAVDWLVGNQTLAGQISRPLHTCWFAVGLKKRSHVSPDFSRAHAAHAGRFPSDSVPVCTPDHRFRASPRLPSGRVHSPLAKLLPRPMPPRLSLRASPFYWPRPKEWMALSYFPARQHL